MFSPNRNTISIRDLDHDQAAYLANSKNTGIEFEYAICLLLLPKDLSEKFLRSVVLHHNKKEKITDIAKKIEISTITKLLSNRSIQIDDLLIATQNDDVGPADLIIIKKNGERIGLSVKFNNNCFSNISGTKYFLSTESKSELSDRLRLTCSNYIAEMQRRYGDVENWFRKRKQSSETAGFIRLVRVEVINQWRNKSSAEKRAVIDLVTQAKSPIPFWVVKITSRGARYELEVNETPVIEIDVDRVALRPRKGCYVDFSFGEFRFATLQVKFNNGILERADVGDAEFVIDGIGMKIGDPFSSWNFSMLV